MQGTILWYSPEKSQGIISVTKSGIVQRYFLLQSRIARSPEVIRAGHFVRFGAAAPPPKQGLLPTALAVEISDMPFAEEGIDALKAGV